MKIHELVYRKKTKPIPIESFSVNMGHFILNSQEIKSILSLKY